MSTQPIAEQEWLAARRLGVGGSDMHHVMEEGSYACKRWLYYDKRGVDPDYNRDNELLFRRGHALEPLIADEYEAATGKKVRRVPMRIVKTRPWERVNCDRQIIGDPRGPGVLEIKSMGEWAFRPVKREGLPVAHVLQLQWAMAVTGYKWGAFAVLEPASWELLTFEMDRKDDLIAAMRDAAERFWIAVQDGNAPAPLADGDKRCESCEFRKTCRGDVAPMQYERPEVGHPAPVDETVGEVVADYLAAKDAEDNAERTVAMVRAQLEKQLGERQRVEVPSMRAKVSFTRSNDGWVWDTDWLDRHHPELFTQARKIRKGARRLTVTVPEK